MRYLYWFRFSVAQGCSNIQPFMFAVPVDCKLQIQCVKLHHKKYLNKKV